MAMGNEELLRGPNVLQPRELHEARRLRRELGAKSLYIAGGTLLRTQWENGAASMPAHLIDLRGIPGLQGISVAERELRIGALTLLGECRKHPLVQRELPAAAEAARTIAAPSIRNLGTVGGNVASRTGDLLPALLALDARLAWYDGLTLVQPLDEWLTGGASASGDAILTEIRVPLSPAPEVGRKAEAYRKVGRREAFAASVVTVALKGVVTDGDRVWTQVRIAAGGGSGLPQRLTVAERLLEGSRADDAKLAELHEAIAETFSTYSDAFASERYRKQTAANLIASEVWTHSR